jgi:uncharacterized protein DUF6869
VLAEQDVWAWQAVADLVAEQPAEAVAALMQIADAAPGDDGLAYLGAGPIEDLLVNHPDETVFDRVDDAARRSESFRKALRGAWYDDSVPAAVRDRLRRFGDPN